MRKTNHILEYIHQIESGEIIVSKKVKAMYEKIKPIVLDQDPIWYYSENRGSLVIEFIEEFCKQSKGKWASKPLELMLFQKAKLQSIFGILNRETKKRKFKEVFDVRGRKNGKSVENSAIALYMLIMDKEQGAEIYSAATVREQAKRVWDESKNMIEQNVDLQRLVRTRTFPQHEIFMERTRSVFRPLSKNIHTLDGLNASCAIIDEVHALPRQIYDLLKQSMAVREQPLMNMITTAGYIRAGLFDDMYDYAKKFLEGAVDNDSFFALIYELDSEDEIMNEDMWIKANPALDVLKDRADLREKVERMKYDNNFASTVKVKDFNIIDVEEKAWLSYYDLNNEKIHDLTKFEGGVAIGAFDLSRTNDLTNATIMFYDRDTKSFVTDSMYWMPEERYRKVEHGKIPYRQWVDRGLIRICPGEVVDYRLVAEWFYQEWAINKNITFLKLPYDAYSAIYLIKEMESLGFSDRCLMKVRQGFLSLSIPMQRIEADLKMKKVSYQNNPVTKWCLSNVQLVEDRNGNLMPAKNTRLQDRKIDGAVGLINAYAGLIEVYEDFITF